MARMEIRRNNRIKLKNSKAVFLSLLQGILHKLFAYMQSSGGRTDGIACIAYMTASADIIGVQDIESEDRSVFILRHPAVGLGSKEIFPGRFIQKLFLRKGDAFLDNLIPDAGHRLDIGIFILSYRDFPRNVLPDIRFYT